MKMAGWKIGGLMLVLLAAGLWACTPETAISPEQAVYLKLKQSESLVTNSIQVQPAVHLQDQYFVLAAYNTISRDEGEFKCTTIFEVGRLDENWEISRHGSGCSSNLYPAVFGTHSGYGLNYAHRAGEFSYTAVETVIADAHWVDITWQDGLTQRVPVINDYFIALRDGSYHPITFVVLDKDEKETYTYEIEP